MLRQAGSEGKLVKGLLTFFCLNYSEGFTPDWYTFLLFWLIFCLTWFVPSIYHLFNLIQLAYWILYCWQLKLWIVIRHILHVVVALYSLKTLIGYKILNVSVKLVCIFIWINKSNTVLTLNGCFSLCYILIYSCKVSTTLVTTFSKKDRITHRLNGIYREWQMFVTFDEGMKT